MGSDSALDRSCYQQRQLPEVRHSIQLRHVWVLRSSRLYPIWSKYTTLLGAFPDLNVGLDPNHISPIQHLLPIRCIDGPRPCLTHARLLPPLHPPLPHLLLQHHRPALLRRLRHGHHPSRVHGYGVLGSLQRGEPGDTSDVGAVSAG